MKKKMLYVLALSLGGLCVISLNAQRTYDNANSYDFIYQSVASIMESNVNGLDPGYAFAYTNANTGGTPAVRPEFIRTDFDGVPLVRLYYPENNDYDSRFTHIEEVSSQFLAADKQFLTVGSFENAAGSALTVALLDEMGNITLQNHFRSEEMANLIGVKGIYNEYTDEFCIIGVQADGFSPGDQKDVIVMGLDNNLHFSWSIKLSSNHVLEDHDFVTDVVLISPSEYAIVGTCNDGNMTTSEPATMSAIVYPGGVLYFNSDHVMNIPGYYDNAAAITRPEPMGSDLWIMSNSRLGSSTNMIILKQMDYVGNVLAIHQINTSGDRYLGFDLEMLPGDLLGISGYKYTAGEAIPFYMRFDPFSGSIVDQKEYPNNISNSGVTAYNENDLLRMEAYQNRTPYFYNDISGLRADNGGIVFTANDDTYTMGSGLGLRAYGISETGTYVTSSCGLIPNTSYTATASGVNQIIDLIFNNAFVSEEGDFMTQVSMPINDNVCGPLYKTDGGSPDWADPAPIGLSVYPNPSRGGFSVSGYTNATNISVHDLSGKLVLQKNVEGDETSIGLDQFEAGTYLVKVLNGDAVIGTEKVQITP